VEINPQSVVIPDAPLSNHTIRVDIQWSPASLPGWIMYYDLNCDQNNYSSSSSNTGSNTFSLTSVGYENYQIQFRFGSLDPNQPTITGTYQLYYDEQLIRSASFQAQKATYSSYAYFNTHYQSPVLTDYNFSIYASEICLGRYENIYITTSRNCIATAEINTEQDSITLTIETGKEFVSFYKNSQKKDTVTFMFNELSSIYLIQDSIYTGTAPTNVNIKSDWAGIIKYQQLVINPQEQFQIRVPDQPRIVYSGGVGALMIEPYSNSICPPYISENLRYTALIKKGSNRGLLYDYDTGISGDTLTNLTPQEDGEKYLDFITEGEILSQTDTVIVKVFTNDENIDTTEAVIIIYPNEIDLQIIPSVISPGDTARVVLKKRGENGLEDFAADKVFNVEIVQGLEYGLILDSLSNDTLTTFSNIPQGFKIIAKDSTGIDSIKIRIKVSREEMGTPIPIPILLEGFGDLVVKVNPFIVEFDPPTISAGDTARIIPKYMNENGNYVEFDSLQTFELGMLGGCTLGYLSAETDSNNYFYEVRQPFYFIADTSADSGSVNIRVGVIDMNQQNRSLTSNNQLQPDNPVTYCFLNTYQTKLFVDEIVVVGNECGSGAPQCSTIVQAPLGFKEEVVEWTGNYIFQKEGYYPETLKISSGGMTYFLRDGEFKLIPLTAPSQDKIYAIPLSESFYDRYEIETCFNKNLNVGKGAYQFRFKSIGETDNYIHKPIIIQVADYADDPYNMKSLSDLETISFENICKALIDFEYERYRKAEQSNDNFFNTHPTIYSILEVYWEHEKYHKRDGMRFLNDKYDKELLRIAKPDGHFTSKTLKKHLETTFSCSQQIRSFVDAKREGEKYIEDALRMFDNFFAKNWHVILIDIYQGDQWKQYVLEELWAQWSDSVQEKITKYQSLLASRPGYEPKPCEAELNKIRESWDPFNIYRNNR